MLCALTVRQLKPGTFEEFRTAWELNPMPAGWTRVYAVRSVEDENQVVCFGFFDGSLGDLATSHEEFDYAAQLARVAQYIESVTTDGVFEVVIDKD